MSDNTENPDNSGQQNPNGGQPSNPMDEIRKFVDALLKEIFGAIKHFLDKKYNHDYRGQIIFTVLVFLILGAILWLGMQDKIKETTIGTLLGSVVGYALGKFSQHKNNKE